MAQLQLTWNPVTRLNSTNIQALSEKIQGVYRLSYKHKDGNIYVFYVGSSEDIKTTLLNSLDGSDNNCIELHIKGYDCYFRYAKVEKTELIPKVVEELYKFYQPSCNDPIKTNGNDLQINVT